MAATRTGTGAPCCRTRYAGSGGDDGGLASRGAMKARWAAVERLMDDLREVRTVALAARVSEVARATIDQAISEAIEAAADSLESPGDERVFARAHSAISRVARVLAAVDVALVRSLS